MKKIYIFYHIFLFDKIDNIVSEQLDRLIRSGILEHSELRVSVMDSFNGIYKLNDKNMEIIKNICDDIYFFHGNLFEFPTLDKLYFHALENSGNYLYFHTKGATRINDKDQKDFKFSSFVGNYSYKNVENWRHIMEHFTIDHWKLCNDYLNKGYDLVGCNYMRNKYIHDLPAHYSGNFWWASSKFINRLSPVNRSDRLNAELWVGRVKHKAICLYPLPDKIEEHNRFVVYTDESIYLNNINVNEFEN